MNLSTIGSNQVALLLLSVQRLYQNLSRLLGTLDANVESFEILLEQITTSMHQSPSTSTIHENDEDFYERICDAQLEPQRAHVTTL